MSESDTNALTSQAYNFAYGEPECRADMKMMPSDFQVTEQLGFEPEEGVQGEHEWVLVRKEGANTDFVARQLADFAGISAREVSFSGLKDRQAITWQWFSLQLPATKVIDWGGLQHPEFSVERAVRQGRKLRRGTHQANDFKIRLRAVSNPELLESRLQLVREQGVPNYFGPQRFGHQGNNLTQALAMFAGRRVKDRNKRSLLLSAARSQVFNQVLSARIAAQGVPLSPMPGDCMMLAGTRSFFCADTLDATLQERLDSEDIQITMPWWGDGEPLTSDQARAQEAEWLAPLQDYLVGLANSRLPQERRAAWLKPTNFSWQWHSEQELELIFTLPRGTFATAVLRELIQEH